MTNPTYEIRSNNVRAPRVAAVDMKLEAIVIPVSDVEGAEQFYRRLGWRQDVTPPRSGVPVHAARLRVLGPIRQDSDIGRPRLSPENLPDRFRHRSRP